MMASRHSYEIPREYRQDYIAERSALINAIRADANDGARPTIDAVFFDDAHTTVSEQAVSYLQPEHFETSDGSPRIGFSVVDTSYVPPVGTIEAVAFDRIRSTYAYDGHVATNRLLGDDARLSAAFSFRRSPAIKLDVTPALTFISGISNGRPVVEGVERTFITKKNAPLSPQQIVRTSTDPTVQAVGQLLSQHQTTRQIETVLASAANQWAGEQLEKLSVPTFGEPAVFQRPVREWASFKNVQMLSGAVFDGHFPLYTPGQIKDIDDIVQRRVVDYDKKVLEPIMAVASLMHFLNGSTASINRQQRAELYDLLDIDQFRNQPRYLGFVRHAGSLAAEKGYIDLKGESAETVDVQTLADELIGMVQKSRTYEEGIQENSHIALGGLKDRAHAFVKFMDPSKRDIRRLADGIANLSRVKASKNRERRH